MKPPADTRVPILMYHQVAPAPSPAFQKYTVSPRAFASQMAWLARASYTPLSLDAFFAARCGAAKFPPRPIVITFDDGFRECLENVAPILKHYHFTATFFVVAGLVGKTSEWLRAERKIAFDLADAGMLRQLCADGFGCGAHSLTHPRLTEISDADCERELRGARARLEDLTRQPVRHLAYPFGANDARVRALAADAGYLTACSTEIGLSDARDSSLALRRVPVTGFDSLLDFMCRVSTGWRAVDLLHHRARLLICHSTSRILNRDTEFTDSHS